ncbi:MAG: TetR/AcrR family transcriptional regulator [Nannocystaceae bacterium]
MSIATDAPKESGKPRAREILAAAEGLLVEQGYEGLTAQAVAQRAGVNKALVFYYWGSTAELFDTVLRRYYARHEAALVEAFAVQGPLPDRVHAIIDAYLDYMEANRGYVRLVQQQVCSQGPHLPTVRRHLADLLRLTTEQLAQLVPKQGPASAKHLHLSLSAMVVNYFTYAPAMGEAWGADPMSEAALAERRAHVHWVVDAWLDRLGRDGP